MSSKICTEKNVTQYKVYTHGLIKSSVCFTIILMLCYTEHAYAKQKGIILMQNSYKALSGDLHVQFQLDEVVASDYFIDINILNNTERNLIERIKFHPNYAHNVSQLSIDCQNFMKGGIYELVVNEYMNSTINESEIERIKYKINVSWPKPKLSVIPEFIGTYPDKPIEITLTFPEVKCTIKNDRIELPEFWLELIYCGQDITCNKTTDKNINVLYAEQVKGLPSKAQFFLKCELFGIAGHYMVQLRPVPPTPTYVFTYAFITVDWNERFVFNVHASSIFPCDPHVGVGVLFEYPTCILDQADRVRLFARLLADVNSIKPPTSLHYVAEQRIIRGQHSLYFDCELFSEKFVEYCFTYVSQAISGAVADIRVDCVPTLPVRDIDSGGWGPWSNWTPCSTTCSGGTRNRYRFCDSPPPRYGAKFCEGSAVETENCSKNISDSWECLYETTNLTSIKLTTNVTNELQQMEIGCRCGCIIKLTQSNRTKIIASSAQSCPGRSFWLIKAEHQYQVNIKLGLMRLSCPGQYLKVRDGDALTSDLIAEYSGKVKAQMHTIVSTDSKLLVEFFSDGSTLKNSSCNGRFLIHMHQIDAMKKNTTTIIKSEIWQEIQLNRKFTTVHIAVFVFAIILIMISALLGIQYTVRYRKYQLTENLGEPDSLAHTPRLSIRSLCDPNAVPSRAISTSTLLSEVAYLVKIRPPVRVKHSILRESTISEASHKNDVLYNKSEVYKSVESIDQCHNSIKDLCSTSNMDLQQKDNSSLTRSDSKNEYSTNDKDSILSEKESCDIKINQPLDAATQLISIENSSRSFKEEPQHQASLYSKYKASSVSSIITLTNGRYSPAVNSVSTATIRPTNQKENKDKQNREKLLARPDSEFSLANPEDFELDYYDYNVVNAGAAPGSYLGMDPAYLVWIPPLYEGTMLQDTNKTEPIYEEILPHHDYIDSGSNKETPDCEDAITPTILAKANAFTDHIKNNFKHTSLTELLNDEHSKLRSDFNHSIENENSLTELTERNTICLNIAPYHTKINNTEKETTVEKLSNDRLQDYYDSIKFADEDVD